MLRDFDDKYHALMCSWPTFYDISSITSSNSDAFSSWLDASSILIVANRSWIHDCVDTLRTSTLLQCDVTLNIMITKCEDIRGNKLSLWKV